MQDVGDARDRRPAPEVIAAALAEMGDLIIEREPARVERRCGDEHWLSPVLRDALATARADAVVAPTTVDQLKAVASACVRHRVPLTVRGGGSGTQGQAVPLAGGIVVDMGYFNRLLAVEQGWCRVQAGCLTSVLSATLHERGRALRLCPTWPERVTIGGFVAAGVGGVGSVRWGTLGDLGAVRAVRLLTMELEPRLLELRGAHVELATHTLGTTGIITEVELPTTDAVRWAERVIGFDTFAAALRFADTLARQDAMQVALVSLIAAPAPGRLLFRHAVDDATHLVLVMVAETALESLDALLTAHAGEALAVAPTPLASFSWQQTTWHAAKNDHRWTHLQASFAAAGLIDTVLALHDRLNNEEIIVHLEFVRRAGSVTCFGFPLIRFSTVERLADLATLHRAAGADVFDAHALTLEGSGRKHVDQRLIAFKHEVDPCNLLNPGKMEGAAHPRTDHNAAEPSLG